MEEKHLHAGIDYEVVPDKSLWGPEDEPTLAAIDKLVAQGTWLNLAAGDGRFNNALLSRCNNVIAADTDAKALSKLVRLTPAEFAGRIKTKILDLTKQFPFPDSHFAGCLCTGTAHMFDRRKLKFVIAEIMRVTRASGSIILDFPTDVERKLPDGSLHKYPDMPEYTAEEGKAILQEYFKGQDHEITQYQRGPAERIIGPLSYTVRCQYLLLTCTLRK